MYIDHIWPFTTFISRNKHKKIIRLRLYWLRLRVAEAEVQTSHFQGLQTGKKVPEFFNTSGCSIF